MAKNKSKGPANPSAEKLRMQPKWDKMDALLGGTENMRAAGRKYLPMHQGEERDRYEERRGMATLWNQTELTLGGWVGRPFRDPISLDDDVPEEIQNLKEDIDHLGTDLDTFCRDWFRVGIAKAFCHILIEQPVLAQREDGQPLTLNDVNPENDRPYWVLIEPDSVIAARQMVIDGKEVLTHLRIHEVTQEQDPDDEFDEVTVERIRVYDLKLLPNSPDGTETGVFVTLYRRMKEATQGNSIDDWEIEVGPFQIGIDQIPLITFYSNRQGFLLGKSPLEDLCDLNIKHWNSQSDQDAILTIARFPILAASGIPDIGSHDATSPGAAAGADLLSEGGAIIGPYRVLTSADPAAKFYYVEHDGKAIAAGEKSLDKLEKQMAAYGSEFLKKSPDRETATARTLDSAESVSPLYAVTLTFMDAVKRALALTAKWMDLEDGGTAELVTDFGPEEASPIDMAALNNARAIRDISRESYLNELIRRGILPEDFDKGKNKLQLSTEALDLEATQVPAAKTDLDAPEKDTKDEQKETKVRTPKQK